MHIYKFGGTWHLGGRFESFVIAKNLKEAWRKLAQSQNETVQSIKDWRKKNHYVFECRLKKRGGDYRISESMSMFLVI